jgi:hypothetical protein
MHAIPPGTGRARGAFARSLLLFAIAGCASVDRPALGGFRKGLSTVQVESAALLQDVNKLARRAQLERIETLAGMLKESDIAPALDADSRVRWNRALEALAAYAASIEVLSDPARGTETEKSVAELGNRINAMAAEPSAKGDELSAAVGRLGRLVVTAWAQREALETMRSADAEVRAVLAQMAAMIGDGVESAGIRGTVWSNWTTLADEIRQGFLSAKPAEKKTIAGKYAEALDQRAASDAGLASVRKALLDLADAHSAISQGRDADASDTIAFLREQMAFSRALLKSAQKPDSGETR